VNGKPLKERKLFTAKYRKGAMMVRPGKLPTLYHTNNHAVMSCEITEAGTVEIGGEQFEYQLLKVILRERQPPDEETIKAHVIDSLPNP